METVAGKLCQLYVLVFIKSKKDMLVIANKN